MLGTRNYSSADFHNLMVEYENIKFAPCEKKIKITKTIISKIMKLYNINIRFITDFKNINVNSLDTKFEEIKEILTNYSATIEKNFEFSIDTIADRDDIILVLKNLLREIEYKITIKDKTYMFVKKA